MKSLSGLSQRVGFIGAGNMASALVRGLAEGGLTGNQLLVTDLDESKVATLEKELEVVPLPDAATVAERADIVVLAVKPGVVIDLAAQLAEKEKGQLWLSIAAGISTAALEKAFPDGARIVRAMPNTPALIGAGATGLCAGRFATQEDLSLAEQLLGSVGITERVDESMMDALTGLSGSGPAYLMLVIEALADGGVRAGLPRAVALRLAAQTVEGAGRLARMSGRHPAELKDAVTSPGGTTIAGVEALERGGLRAALMAAVSAAATRSKELGDT